MLIRDWSSDVCSSDREEEVATEHRHIAAIVPDRQKFAMWLKSDAKALFPLLTDVDNAYAMSLGLAFFVGDEMKHMMVNSGWDPSVSQGTDNWTLPIPATFIVGTEGIVHARSVEIGRASCRDRGGQEV